MTCANWHAAVAEQELVRPAIERSPKPGSPERNASVAKVASVAHSSPKIVIKKFCFLKSFVYLKFVEFDRRKLNAFMLHNKKCYATYENVLKLVFQFYLFSRHSNRDRNKIFYLIFILFWDSICIAWSSRVYQKVYQKVYQIVSKKIAAKRFPGQNYYIGTEEDTLSAKRVTTLVVKKHVFKQKLLSFRCFHPKAISP